MCHVAGEKSQTHCHNLHFRYHQLANAEALTSKTVKIAELKVKPQNAHKWFVFLLCFAVCFFCFEVSHRCVGDGLEIGIFYIDFSKLETFSLSTNSASSGNS